jgi:hypothetical protein
MCEERLAGFGASESLDFARCGSTEAAATLCRENADEDRNRTTPGWPLAGRRPARVSVLRGSPASHVRGPGDEPPPKAAVLVEVAAANREPLRATGWAEIGLALLATG